MQDNENPGAGRAIRHLVFPALAPLAFFAVAATPVEVIGCRNRGLLALLIVFIGLAGAIATTAIATRRRKRGEPDFGWWAASTLLLCLPAVALLFLA